MALAGDTVVCAGYTEAGGGHLYSSAVCVSGDGVLGRQRKVHLPPGERFAFRAGDGFAAFDTPVGRIGMLLCYDKLFPEAARALALDGAEIVVLASPPGPSTATAPPGACATTARRTASPLRPGARGREPGLLRVLEPDRPVGRAEVPRRRAGGRPRRRRARPHGRRPGLAVARADLAEIRASRAVIDHLADRRPEAYGSYATR